MERQGLLDRHNNAEIPPNNHFIRPPPLNTRDPASIREISYEIGLQTNTIAREMGSLASSGGVLPQHHHSLQAVLHSTSRLAAVRDRILDGLYAWDHGLVLYSDRYRFRDHLLPTFKELSAIGAHKGIVVKYFIDNSIPEFMIYDGSQLRRVLFTVINGMIAEASRGEVMVTASVSTTGIRGAVEIMFMIKHDAPLNNERPSQPPARVKRHSSSDTLTTWVDPNTWIWKLVKLMGGELSVRVHSRPGIRFSVTFQQNIPNTFELTRSCRMYKESRILVVENSIQIDDHILKTLGDFCSRVDVVRLETICTGAANVPRLPFEAILVGSVDEFRQIRKVEGMGQIPIIYVGVPKYLDLTSIFSADTSQFYITPVRNVFDIFNTINEAFSSIQPPSEYRILAAEPYKADHLILQTFLQGLKGAKVTVCENAPLLYEHFVKERPDIILMAFDGDDRYGEQTAERIRLYERTNGLSCTPLIALVPRTACRGSLRWIPCVFNAHLEVPLCGSDLHRIINFWVRKNRLPSGWD